MNLRGPLPLIGILLVLGGYIYFFELSGYDQDPAQSSDGHVQIYGAPYGEYDVVELEVVGPQGRARFARTQQSLTRDWAMVLPRPLPPEALDQARVNGAATRLARLSASRVITGALDLGQYGLQTPQLTVTLTISDGQKIILYSGDQTPVGDNRYLRLAQDDHSIYIITSFAMDDLRSLLETPPLAPTPLPTLTPTPFS